MIGMTVGAYRVVQQIGEGGMGSVWLAEHAMLGRRAAIKLLHPAFSVRPEIVTRFFNEARAATAISDPGIVQIFDFGHHTDGSAYIVMELLEGETLEKRIRMRGLLPVGEALRIMRQVATSLGAAHARGIVHRDLKPENIFLVRDVEVAGGERAKILDFGIAKLTGDPSIKTQTSAVMGTPMYMSPEQCRGAGQVDQRSDVYALGCVLFATITGRPPFDAEGAGEIIAMHLREPAIAPSALAGGIPPEVDALVLRCLHKDPAARFASATELAYALDALRATASQLDSVAAHSLRIPNAAIAAPTTLSSASGVRTAGSLAPAPRPRSRVGLLVGAGALVAGGAVAAFLAVGRTPAPAAASAADEPAVAAAAAPASAAPVPPDAAPAPELASMSSALTTFTTWAAAHAGAPCPDAAALGLTDASIAITCTDQPSTHRIGLVAAGPDGTRGTDDDLTSWSALPALARGERWRVEPATTVEPKTVEPKTVESAKKSERKKPRTTTSPSPPAKPAPPDSPIKFDGVGIPMNR